MIGLLGLIVGGLLIWGLYSGIRALLGIRLGHVTLDCMHCGRATEAGREQCQHCGGDL